MREPTCVAAEFTCRRRCEVHARCNIGGDEKLEGLPNRRPSRWTYTREGRTRSRRVAYPWSNPD